MASTSVFLNVADIARALAFYKTLGFKVVSSTKDREGRVWFADLAMEGAELGLGNIPSSRDPAFQAWVSTPLGAGVVVYVTVDDVDRVHARAKKAGAVVEVPPEDRDYGRVLTLNDPDGYVLTFLQEPSARRATPKKKAPARAKKAKAPRARPPARSRR